MSFSDDVEKELKERWDDLTSWMSVEIKKSWWEKLKAAYLEPQRKYHTLNHLHQMFQHYDQHKDNIQNRYACAYAIFFHDIVYDPKASDNEERSSELFMKFSGETTLDQSSFVVDLIKSTASHCTDAHLDSDNTGIDDIHYFLDIDMAILGAETEDYDLYRKQIREEFSHLDDATYAKGRAKVLDLFLKIPNIYATQVFRESYEKRARENIKREIEFLVQGKS